MNQLYSETPTIPASREGPTPLGLPAFFPILTISSILSKFLRLSLRELRASARNLPPLFPVQGNLPIWKIWFCLPTTPTFFPRLRCNSSQRRPHTPRHTPSYHIITEHPGSSLPSQSGAVRQIVPRIVSAGPIIRIPYAPFA